MHQILMIVQMVVLLILLAEIMYMAQRRTMLCKIEYIRLTKFERKLSRLQKPMVLKEYFFSGLMPEERRGLIQILI